MRIVKDDDYKTMAEGAAKEAHQTMLRPNILLAGAIALAMLLGVMCRRAEARPRIDIVGDVDMATTMLTPAALATPVDVDVFIDSPGGYLDGAKAIMAAIEKRKLAGLHTRCYSTRAMSAAFMIFSSCDERLASPYGRFRHHYAYIVTERVTVDNVEHISTRISTMKNEMDKWADLMFTVKAPLMKQYMAEERVMSGRELCSTFVGFCHVSYIFPILEQQ